MGKILTEELVHKAATGVVLDKTYWSVKDLQEAIIDGSDIQRESIYVTSNGTYTPSQGRLYSSVTVDVRDQIQFVTKVYGISGSDNVEYSPVFVGDIGGALLYVLNVDVEGLDAIECFDDNLNILCSIQKLVGVEDRIRSGMKVSYLGENGAGILEIIPSL